MKKICILLLAGAVMLTNACNEKPSIDYFYYDPADYALMSQYLNLPETPLNYDAGLGHHLKLSGLKSRGIDFDKATLGRVLFYDQKLSKDGTISCASCHKQELAFGDNVAFSRGVEDRTTARNSIALFSVSNFASFYGEDINGSNASRFFWDNRAATVAEQSEGSFTNPQEMGMHMDEVVAAVKAQPYYTPLFGKAFQSDEINQKRILEALTSFVNSISAVQTKFDTEAEKLAKTLTSSKLSELPAIARQDFPGFTAEENQGKQLYMDNCAGCHSDFASRPVFENAANGILDNAGISADSGVGGITGKAEDMGTFKVPLLRNVALTAPYMHDGRFATLGEVIDHYSYGIQASTSLHPLLRKSNGQVRYMNFSPAEKQALIAFLHTLTDTQTMTDPRFSSPFK